MKYGKTEIATFLSRPNRFIANCIVNGEKKVCHVKNTGRCKELLTKGCQVILEDFTYSNRKTKYDLIQVYKNDRLINMDSQAPNKAVKEFLPSFLGVNYIKPEYSFGSSRIDFYAEKGDEKYLIEVKGCTLEQDGICYFPDAPTERGLKHIIELTNATKLGYKCIVFILIQMSNVKYFAPNYLTMPGLAEAMIEAKKQGVEIVAYDSIVSVGELKVGKPVEVKLEDKSALVNLVKNNSEI